MLRDDQVRRYARQVLLREVGGKGQERLLAALVRARGEGLALETAAAYLAAGGSQVAWAGPRRGTGFLEGEVEAALAELNPDAAAAGEAPAPGRPGLWCEAGAVVVGPGRVAWFPAPVCPHCVAGEPGGEGGVVEGALAALALQRLLLGLERAAGALALDAEGGQRRAAPGACAEHAGGG